MQLKHYNTILILIILLIIAIPTGFLVGAADISISKLLSILFNRQVSVHDVIIYDIRMPRMLISFLVGASLAVAGTVFQGILLNPLADSFTIGVASGAAFGASFAILFGVASCFLPLFALVGAFGTLLIVLFISIRTGGLEPRNLVLSGIIVSSFLSAGISFIKTISGDSLNTLVFWLMGTFSGRGWQELYLFLPYFLIGISIIIYFARDLDLLSLGEEQAKSLGVNVKRSRTFLIISAALISAAAVSISGIIGFVGLIVPHLLRLIFGASHKRLVILSIFTGGILLLWSDILVRSLSFWGEIPVGVITSLLGGPFFCLILLKKRSL